MLKTPACACLLSKLSFCKLGLGPSFISPPTIKVSYSTLERVVPRYPGFPFVAVIRSKKKLVVLGVRSK